MGEVEESNVVQEMCVSLLESLLLSRDFERAWTNRVVAALQGDADADDEADGRQGAESRKGAEPRPLPPLTEAIEELTETVRRTTETFERSADLALFHAEPATPNRDAGAIFDCRRVMGRVVESKEARGSEEEQTTRMLIATRRLTRLTRTLGLRLGSPYHVANCCVLASAVCDLGLCLEDAIMRGGRRRGRGGVDEERLRRLRDTLDEMNERVVGGMRQLMSTVVARTAPPTTPSRSASLPLVTKKALSGKRRPNAPRPSPSVTTITRSPGFLLPYELQQARARVPYRPASERLSIDRPMGAKGGRGKFMTLPDPVCRVGREVAELERKWSTMLNAEAAFLKSALRGEKAAEAATRMARDITREVLEELERRKRREE